MENRKILYGYQIHDGMYTIHPEEGSVVQRAFQEFQLGLSYQRIAEGLNRDGICYSDEVPVWNKNKVKRLLENHRYVGTELYPPIIEKETFNAVQEYISEKRAAFSSKGNTGQSKLWKKLQCAECRGQLLRLGGGQRQKDCLHLRCKSCDAKISIPKATFESELQRQATGQRIEKAAYTPSQEVYINANNISRALEQPRTPEVIVAMILQGISIRYSCCEAGGNDKGLNDSHRDMHELAERITYITVSTENRVTVYY